MINCTYWGRFLGTIGVCLVLAHSTAEAYIGPGAGFAFVSSFFLLFATFLLVFFTIATWPVRWLYLSIRGQTAYRNSRYNRVVILGLDGQDPDLTDAFLKQGILPNFERLRKAGDYKRLGTTLPAESPVAWSSFQTGCNPGRHRVFDFLVPNRKTYLPELSSARVDPPARTLSLGPYQIPLGKARIQAGRKSQPFWKILGDHGVFSTVLRVPITFPAEKFRGALLSAMSVPDLKGTQGTFTYYSSDPQDRESYTGGFHVPVSVQDGHCSSNIVGPENTLLKEGGETRLPFELTVLDDQRAELRLAGQVIPLSTGEFTPWIELAFPLALGLKVRGVCQFYLKETGPHLRLYQSPLNIDPSKPALPISYPYSYSVYLAKTQGTFSTLGIAEDTWSLNERVLDESAFLKQCYSIHRERERMFLDALDKTSRGATVCVFDITDRLQHMFWRYLEKDHPANLDKDQEIHQNAIRDLYTDMDLLVGKVLDKIKDDDLLVVMSDHGFKSFQRGVNLNSWLYQKGLLCLNGQPSGAEWFEGVDWSRTKAYAVGLGGIYLNLTGRESRGIVERGSEAKELKRQISQGLESLLDEEKAAQPVRKVWDTTQAYSGPYVEDAPDLIVGFSPGYRASWTCATGAVTDHVIEDNCKSWSGDHCVNPPDVPGILFTNQKIEKENPSIVDLGPTVLDAFGVTIPNYCDGESLLPPAPVPAN